MISKIAELISPDPFSKVNGNPLAELLNISQNPFAPSTTPTGTTNHSFGDCRAKIQICSNALMKSFYLGTTFV
jgi:hypothetical protein